MLSKLLSKSKYSGQATDLLAAVSKPASMSRISPAPVLLSTEEINVNLDTTIPKHKPMTIRYVSDLHLEFIKPMKLKNILYFMSKVSDSDSPFSSSSFATSREYPTDSGDEVTSVSGPVAFASSRTGPDANVLVLAGDIGNPYSENYKEFMTFVNATYPKTFVIAGNHEYYQKQHTIEETKTFMKEFFAGFPNISFLDDSMETYNGFHFIGTTLWSHISQPQYEINDVYMIPYLDHKQYNKLNKQCVEYLNKTVQELDNNCIIISHHQPSETVIDPKYMTAKMRPYNQWFYSNMDSFIQENNKKIKCWIYGHTHTPRTSVLFDVPLVCNPIGYPGENAKNDYSKTITIDPSYEI